MLKRVVWKDDSVFSLQLRDDLFTLAQMRRNHIMQFFDLQRADENWSNIDLKKTRSLFFIFVAENKLKPLFSSKPATELVCPSDQPIPSVMLSAVIENAGVVGANLIELDENYSVAEKRVIKENLTPRNDLELIYKHELSGMIGDPEKIRNRLLRFFDTGINWDDAKSLLFKGIKLPSVES